MADRVVLTVEARKVSGEGWMLWGNSQMLGTMYSLAEVEARAAEVGADMHEARWPDGSYQQMVDAGVAPSLDG